MTLSPAQKLNGPEAVITGLDGRAFTVTLTTSLAGLSQPLALRTFTE
jgi:hypothetical protein